jgi:hypothetical protein
MADQNPIWNKISSGPGQATESVMGPSYSYMEHIKSPSEMGVGSRGTIGQISTNTGAISQYIKYMVSGPPLGNRYFVNTGGSCEAPDKSTQSRYNFINNVASGADVLPQSMKSSLGGIASNFNGLIPGMMEDAEGGLNPVHLFSSLSADSTPACECYTCETSGGPESRFLNVDLTADFNPDLCKQDDISKCVQTKEGFTDMSGDVYPLLIGIGIVAVFIAVTLKK